MSWTPDESASDSESPRTPGVLLKTEQALPVRLARIESDHLRPEDGQAVGAFLGDAMIARQALLPDAMEWVLSGPLFDEPVPLLFLAQEASPGIQGRLYALVPRERARAADAVREPWAAATPSFEDAMADQSEVAIYLGDIVRFAAKRKFPEDLGREAADLLNAVLRGAGADATTQAIDDLLSSL